MCVCPRLYTVRYGTHVRRARERTRVMRGFRGTIREASFTLFTDSEAARPPTSPRHGPTRDAAEDISAAQNGMSCDMAMRAIVFLIITIGLGPALTAQGLTVQLQMPHVVAFSASDGWVDAEANVSR